MIGWLIGVAVALLLVFALLAPLESLRWWSRRQDAPLLAELVHSEEDEREQVHEPGPDGLDEPGGRDERRDDHRVVPPPRRFVIYLSGIGAVDGRTDSRRERAVLTALAESMPDVVVAADVFPYAVENRGLTERASTWFWSVLQRLQRVPVARIVSNLINLRNAFRVLVSADPRYGPTFNLAVAQEVAASLSRHGYDWHAPVPVTLVGYSGGGQIALGASWYLAGTGVPVSVISIGGVLSDDPALDRIEHLWHFYGARDRMHRLGDLLFPGRWPTAPLSTWYGALREGRITRKCIGRMRHMGGRDYFDRHASDGGANYRELTITALQSALARPALTGQGVPRP